MRQAVVIDPEDRALEHWEEPGRGAVRWRTLISSDRTETEDLVCGLAYFGAAEALAPHRHDQPEIVHVLAGDGTAALGDRRVRLTPGLTVFVPPNLEHGFRGGGDGLVLLYVFAVSSFAEIVYRFAPPDDGGSPETGG